MKEGGVDGVILILILIFVWCCVYMFVVQGTKKLGNALREDILTRTVA